MIRFFFLIVFTPNFNYFFPFYNVIKISLVLLNMVLRAVCRFNVTIFGDQRVVIPIKLTST